MKITRIKRGNKFTNVISAKDCEFCHLLKALKILSKFPNTPMLMTEEMGMHDDVLLLTEEFLAKYNRDKSGFPDDLKKIIHAHMDKWNYEEKPVKKKKPISKKNYHKIEVT